MTLKTRKPRNPAYPRDLKSLGDHIRERRLDLGLRQKDVATMVNATTSTITNWEKGRRHPTVRFTPKVLEFLGYDPYPPELTSLGHHIKQIRRIRGIGIKKLAIRLGIDPGTLAKWEKSEVSPRNVHRKLAKRISQWVTTSQTPRKGIRRS